MAKFLIIIMISIALFFIGYGVSFFLRVVRFWIKVNQIKELHAELFGYEKFEKECKEIPISIQINDCRWEFNNFPDAVNYLEKFGKDLLDECQRLANIVGDYELKEGEQTILDAVNQASMWKWKNGYIENSEKNDETTE